MGPFLTGRPLADAVQLDTDRFLLRFDEPPFPRIHIAIHPRISTMHLARGVKAPAAPTELAVALTRELEGRRVLGLSMPEMERLVRIDFEQGRALVVELMGRASNMLLLDHDERILRFARSHAGAFRRPAIGGLYVPPPVPPRWVEQGMDAIDEAGFREILADESRGSTEELRLARALPGVSVHLAREIAWLAGAGADPWRAHLDLAARARSGTREPVYYSPAAGADLSESLPLTNRNMFAFPFSLSHASHLTATRTPTVNEAEEAVTACVLRHLEYASLHESLSALLRQERRKVADLIEVLEADLAEASRCGDQDRRRGELILAGLHAARKEGTVVRVVDYYDPDAREVAIPVNPRLSLGENAQRYFKAARRRERARAIIPGRLESLKRRRADLDGAADQPALARSRRDLEEVERSLQEKGLIRAFRKSRRPEVARRPEYVEVREFRSVDGFTIIVGKTGAENDHLTFSVAAPHDLWLHAAGWPGAHVIVRNPGRLASLPQPTVLQAAAIAAHFSKGKEQGEMDVHVAWRKHVRKGKGKGMGPGMVMLRRHKTVRVAPGLPRSRGPVGR